MHLDEHLLHLFELLEVVRLHLLQLLLFGHHHVVRVLHLAEVRSRLVEAIQSETRLGLRLPALVKLVHHRCSWIDYLTLDVVSLLLVGHHLAHDVRE